MSKSPIQFSDQDNQLYIGDVLAASLAAEYGSPLYVYAAEDIRQRCRNLQAAFAELQPQILYSVKANSNLSILCLLSDEGIGFDIVSEGELMRLQAAQIDTCGVGFAGVGKTKAEIEYALAANIGFFNVESPGELVRIAQIAASRQISTRVMLRLNPNVDADTHKFITTGTAINKFGMDFETAAQLCRQFQDDRFVQIAGFHMHLGSQIKRIEPYVTATQKILDFIRYCRAEGQSIDCFNLGGGYGISYDGAEALSFEALASALTPLLKGQNLQIMLEPGRSLIARSGVLLTQVQYIKQTGDKTFVVVDSGMHHMIRPALYNGWHKIWPIDQAESTPASVCCDVVGPICESTDFLAQDRLLPSLKSGDILALFDAGAYGFVMASNYNSHFRPAEVLVEDGTSRLIRQRETFEDLIALESAYL